MINTKIIRSGTKIVNFRYLRNLRLQSPLRIKAISIDEFNNFMFDMAALLCFFSVSLCKFGGHDTIENTNQLKHSDDGYQYQSVLPLSAQFVTVPRVSTSPCPEIFRYTFNGKDWAGLVVIKKPARSGIPLRLKINLSVGLHLSSVSDKWNA